MKDANQPVKTAAYVRQLNLNRYIFGTQYDAEECLNQILNDCFPIITESIFCVRQNEALECEMSLIPGLSGGCGAKQEKFENHQILKLSVQESDYQQSVQDIVNSTFNSELLDDYRCAIGEANGCQQVGFCKKTTLITELKDLLIIQLKIFDAGLNKMFPALHVDQDIALFETFELKGIIYHHGNNLRSGHYTSMIKNSGQWLHISDSDFHSYPIKFGCKLREASVPYLLFYVKVSNNRQLEPATSINIQTPNSLFVSDSVKRKAEEMDTDMEDIDLLKAKQINESSPTSNFNVTPNKKFNFAKKKGKFTPKVKNTSTPESREIARKCMRKLRETEEGREKSNKIDKESKRNLRETEEGREKSNMINKKSMRNLRETEEGNKRSNMIDRESKRNLRDTKEGREKSNMIDKESKRNLRETEEGNKRSNMIDRESKRNLRETKEGKEKSNMIDKESKRNLRETTEGRVKSKMINKKSMRKLRETDEGKENNKEASKNVRSEKKSKEEDFIQNITFPPDIKDGQERECMKKFIEHTSPKRIQLFECGICGECVLERDITSNSRKPLSEIPHKELLSVENQEDPNVLPEYVVDDLVLSPGGIDNEENVLCCRTCLTSLNNNKLPALSIANGFQIGKTPPELSDLTLPEKVLISKNRAKLYVVTLHGSCGPQGQQKGLKGNTITFPQDVVKISTTLPNPDTLVDDLKVVFVGKGRPTKEMLKKVLTCRIDKIYTALNFLVQNNPEYANVSINTNVNLPDDDVPEEIMRTIDTQDPDDEDVADNTSYTRQTDLNDIPPDDIVMNSAGIVDIDGSTVPSTEQMESAISSLQGTLVVPHGSIPVNEYNNPSLWYGAYPWLFPYERGGPETQRKIKVGLRAYAKHMLRLADRKFSLDLSFKFHIFNVIQKRDVSYHTSLHVRRPAFHSTAARIDTLTPQAMEDLIECVKSKTPIRHPGMRALLDSMSSAGKSVKGSSFQKATYRKEIFGLMIQEGSPVLWITLSPAAVHSPIFLQIAGQRIDLSDLPSHVERAKLVANDPVAAAMYFNEVIDAFTAFLLGYKDPEGGLFGHPSAYYGMVEEQGTGTLHNHMLVWLHNFRSASKLRAEMEDEMFQKKLIQYLERIIKQGYLGTAFLSENLDVSEVSCKYPVNPDKTNRNFDQELIDDVNELVTVANTHKCRSSCYKYSKKKECRHDYPRELVSESVIEGNDIKLERTDPMINNFNPYVMTCIRSNHDIKFIPSGKDGKNIAFYVTNYATKSQQSMHQMIPLIAASKKRLDAEISNTTQSLKSRTQALITKCLNRTTTDVELSGAHVAHFLLGFSDNKTSHKFTGLNLHGALAWLAKEIKKNDDLSDAYPFDDNLERTSENSKNSGNKTNAHDSDDDDDGEDQPTYTVSTGNEGLVFVNQMTDYTCRGDALKDMCLYEYCSRVYKTKFSEEELKKHNDKVNQKKTTARYEQRLMFSSSHPQSETHWQKVRLEGNTMVPTLSKLPPSNKDNKDTYQKCILLLFKPFTTLEDLFDGISWNDTFASFLEVTNHKQYIENIEEMHKGIEEKNSQAENEENDEDVIDENLDVCNDDDDSNQLDEDEMDALTSEALDVIQSNTPWLEESVTDHQRQHNFNPVFQNPHLLPPLDTWKVDLNQQNLDKLNNVKPDENETDDDSSLPDMASINQTQVEIALQETVDTQDAIESFDEIVVDVMNQYNLNNKQKVAFKMAIQNVIKRHRQEETHQIVGYVGGPGGTGKSQVIKAIVEFHKRLKVENTLKLCANTGTAAKHIGGSTTTTLFGFSSKSKSKLEKHFENVHTIILDEVSMIGCRQLVKISKALTRGKCVDSSLPFGGIDIIFCGDFIQFSPVKDSPLYCGWYKQNTKKPGGKNQSSMNKDIGMHLWKQITHIVLLDEQMRVQDTKYLEMLNRLREGKCTDRDIAMINSRIVGQNVDITSISGAPIVTPGNKLVMAINDLFVTRHSQNTPVYVSTAKDKIGKDTEVPRNVASKYKNWACTATQGVPRELQLFIGMPVIITSNIKTELGITNGTSGIVRHIQFNTQELIGNQSNGIHHLEHHPEYIIVELDDVDIKPLDGLPPNHVPITPVKKSFSVNVPGKNEKVSVNRTHFPLVPRFSCTAHKSQGQTLSKAIVDLVPVHGKTGGIGIEFAYVPLSRVRRLEDLTILRPFDPSVLKTPVNEGCAAMMDEFKKRDLAKDL